MITAKRKRTNRTMKNSIRQLEFMSTSTSTACLRSIGGIYFNHLFPGPFCLESKKIKEHPPSRITNAFVNIVKITLLHIVNRQIFNGYNIKFVYKFTGFLMGKILTLPGDSFMYAGNYFSSFCFGFRSFFLSRKLLLCFSKIVFFLSKKAGIFNLFAIRKSGKTAKSHIKPDSWFDRLFNGFMINITGKVYKPFSCRGSANSASFNYTFNVPVLFDSNLSYFRNVQKLIEPETTLGEGEAVVSISTSKSWITRHLSCLNSAKESLKSKINSHGDILKNLTVNVFEKRLFFLEEFKSVALIKTRKALFLGFPGCFAFLKKMIIQPSAAIKSLFKQSGLFVGGKNSIFESFSHGYILNMFCLNVKNYFI